ncbi:MAG TPA: endoglycosylceramidase, partial [Pilimelia sp.]|nr:endoglycosylceramidase [Pilimelia sp.]
HQDLYSRYLFHAESWYTGDGAPQWVIAAGHYPREFCGICDQWGQNIKQNAAVQEAMYDFWHNRVLTTPAGPVGVQDAFLNQLERTLRYLREHLGAHEFARILGLDPLNEPYAGRYDRDQNGESWERDLLLPFHLKVRQRMDAAGWQDKPAYVEPNMFWDANLGFMKEPGGFVDVGRLGPRLVFNTHFYDQQALSGIFMWGKANDGQYTADFGAIRQRAADLGTAAIVSEFGSPVTGYTSDKTPTVLKGMYQALDSAARGRDWWRDAARSGPVLSAMQWQWDIYNGRHHEPMNGNPHKIQTAGDAWNSEDFSMVQLDDTGSPRLRVDPRLIDRIYPTAVAGHTLAFTYEDRARDGTTLTWNQIPASLPNVATLVGSGQYAVIIWRSGAGDAPTELHLPSTFTPANTTVISDLGTSTSAANEIRCPSAEQPIVLADQTLILSAPGTAGAIHYALVANGPQAPTAGLRAAARQELARWAADMEFPG